jgi:hypothetical protein
VYLIDFILNIGFIKKSKFKIIPTLRQKVLSKYKYNYDYEWKMKDSDKGKRDGKNIF